VILALNGSGLENRDKNGRTVLHLLSTGSLENDVSENRHSSAPLPDQLCIDVTAALLHIDEKSRSGSRSRSPEENVGRDVACFAMEAGLRATGLDSEAISQVLGVQDQDQDQGDSRWSITSDYGGSGLLEARDIFGLSALEVASEP